MTNPLGPWQEVALRNGASKAEHSYMPVYERLLGGMIDDYIRILEIGVCVGGSLKTWLELFPKAIVFGVDVVNNVTWTDQRCSVYTYNQADPEIRGLFPHDYLDVVIDDGSHVFHHQTAAREFLWHALKPGGWWFIEDILDLNDLKYWATFDRFAVFTKFMRRIDHATGRFDQRHSVDDVLVVLRKTPCPEAWEW